MTSLTRNEIVEALKGALDRASNGRAQLDQLDDEMRLIEDIGLSSLDLLELRHELEDRWKMTLADEELLGMKTIGDIVSLTQQRAATSTHSAE